MKYTVYIHTNNSNGKVYVGLTSRPCKERWKNGRGYEQNKHFWAAICKYGWDGFTHEVYAESLTKDEAARLEQFLISFFDSTNPEHGYNVSVGGEGGHTKYKTEEEREAAKEKKRQEKNHGRNTKYKTKEEREEARRAYRRLYTQKQREMRAKLKTEWDAAHGHINYLTIDSNRKQAYTR